MLNFAVNGAHFRDVGDLLKTACASKVSASGVKLRWMILYSSLRPFSQSSVDAMKRMECDYETRTVESLPEWNTTDQPPYTDYKVVSVGLSIEDLRRALAIYVSDEFILYFATSGNDSVLPAVPIADCRKR